ncbi:hypothetical protein GCM10009093_20620 [Brevundimonas terrae]|uniref:Glycerophosphoryl diester phosphodiesterase membrane domain-containing protein n=1 Tax=Brevundimonas terrae TaxID=363631 RepID=A0ABN0YFJ3_9CAUL|nr:hypothetical protein [Brevundimonas terrae]NIJ26808.1 hypothetical protein [Brevundimonas terrae]
MKFGATDAVFEGFRITRQKPVLLLWLSLVYAVTSAIAVALAYQPFVQLMEVVANIQSGQQPDEAEAMKIMGAYGRVIIVALPLSLIATAVTYPAVVRAILTPEDSRFGYLRLGRDELNTFVVILALTVVWSAVILLAGGIVGVAAMGGMAAAMLVGLLVFCGVVAFAIWFGVKFSLAVPITVAEKRIAIMDSFRMTKGHFWPLLGMAFLAGILSFGVNLLVNIISMPFAAISGGGFGLLTGQGVTALTVTGFIGTVVLSLLMASAQALILYAPFAAAYRMLKPN